MEVADEGPGLSRGAGERVFERFYRVDKARTRGQAPPSPGGPPVAHNGSGLGLAIVAALVAAHDGTVEVADRARSGGHLPGPAAHCRRPTDKIDSSQRTSRVASAFA